MPFAVTSIALIIGRNWPRLIQPLVKSLIGSPDTLLPQFLTPLAEVTP